jgi:bifunctional DNA-binding transcriptional regulator/antitoxin component of YhaV-PrlF toxin-antitoxin module
VTAQPIAPVIPSRGRPAARAGGRAVPVRRLPLAAAPDAPALPDEVVYGSGRIDVSGRVGDRAIVGVLGWRPGDRLTLTAAAGVVIARRDPGGLVTMPAKPYLTIPAALRHRCGLRPGDRVVLAVFAGEDALAAFSFAVVDQALRVHVPFARCAGGES